MDWQCDIQVAYGSLWKAFRRFGLFQEGEAAARLLAHVSDLKHEGKKGSDILIVSFEGIKKKKKTAEDCKFLNILDL